MFENRREVVSWARQRACPLGVVERLWKLYVEAAVGYGLAVIQLSATGEPVGSDPECFLDGGVTKLYKNPIY